MGMNMFFIWRSKDNTQTELVTAPLDGTILPGVTRDSILKLARENEDLVVSERPFTIHDVQEAVQEGRMVEAFGAGTAALVCPVKGIRYKDQYLTIPLHPTDPTSEAGVYTALLKDQIMSIQYGETAHPWSIVVE